MRRAITSIAILMSALCGILPAQAADSATQSVWSGAYTPQQAQRGRTVYVRDCETCHGPALEGGEARALTGAEFIGEWYGQSVGDLFEKLRSTMPDTKPGSLSAQ